jgi:hypothetical protein
MVSEQVTKNDTGGICVSSGSDTVGFSRNVMKRFDHVRGGVALVASKCRTLEHHLRRFTVRIYVVHRHRQIQ